MLAYWLGATRTAALCCIDWIPSADTLLLSFSLHSGGSAHSVHLPRAGTAMPSVRRLPCAQKRMGNHAQILRCRGGSNPGLLDAWQLTYSMLPKQTS